MSEKIARHKSYTKNIYGWQSVEDAVEGSTAVKLNNVLYLPMPLGFEQDDTAYASSSNPAANRASASPTELLEIAPFRHHNKAYQAYLQRARFPELTVHTMRGLIGVATRVSPEWKLPSRLKYLEEDATKKGQGLNELFAVCLMEVLRGARVELVLDVDEEANQFRIVVYSSKQFVNWLESEADGSIEMAVFEETNEEMDPDDPSKLVEKKFTITHHMTKDSEDKSETSDKTKFYYTVTKQEVNGEMREDVQPSLQGKKFEEIPVVVIGSLENECEPGPTPLLPVAEIAYSIYRKDADLSQAEYMTCNPIFVISGSDSSAPVAMGSTVALVLSAPEAKADFAKTDTSALKQVTEHIKDLREEAATFGATMFGPTKKGAESTDTTAMRRVAQGATLVGIVENISKGIEEILKAAARLSGVSDDGIMFAGSTDFVENMLTSDMLKALMTLWQGGAYSLESLLTVVADAGFVIDDDVAEELARIAAEAPKMTEPEEEDEEEDEEEEDDEEEEVDLDEDDAEEDDS